jgi:hypothetical protein
MSLSPRVYNKGMAFSEEIVLEAWKRSRERCECTTYGHSHQGRCSARLLWTLQGAEFGGGWRACRKAAWGTDVLTNCEILCAGCQKPPQPVRVH